MHVCVCECVCDRESVCVRVCVCAHTCTTTCIRHASAPSAISSAASFTLPSLVGAIGFNCDITDNIHKGCVHGIKLSSAADDVSYRKVVVAVVYFEIVLVVVVVVVVVVMVFVPIKEEE